MKKKMILALALCMAMTMAVPGAVFAADTVAITAPVYAAASTTTFTTPAVKLSLNDTYKKLETSSTMELLKLSKLSDEADAKGFSEQSSNLKKANDKFNEMQALDPTKYLYFDDTNKPMVELNRDYNRKLIEPNNTARMNQFNSDVYKTYYTLQYLDMSANIAKESLAVAKTLLNTTNLKFKTGSVSKMDVLKAEMEVKNADDDYTAAANQLTKSKMDFNMYIGNPLLQDFTLTDTLSERPLPEKTLEQSIIDAQKNRIDVLSAEFGLEMARLNFNTYKAYPHNSSKYIDAQIGLTQAQINSDNLAASLEKDVREKYMDMMQSYQKVQSGKQNVANAMETARLAGLQYTAGLCTLTDVQSAQIGSTAAQSAQAKALLDYYLAVDAYNYCSGVGVLGVKVTQ